MQLQTDITRTAKRPPTNRSRVTNGSAPFVDGDGRGQWARRWRDLVEAHVGDLGGVTGLSEAQLSMCRRIATLEVEIERMEGALSKGDAVDLDLYNRAAGNLRRLLETIGIERRAKIVTPTHLADHFSRPYQPAVGAE